MKAPLLLLGILGPAAAFTFGPSPPNGRASSSLLRRGQPPLKQSRRASSRVSIRNQATDVVEVDYEQEFMEQNAEFEKAEQERLRDLRSSNMSAFLQEVWDFYSRMKDYPVPLRQDSELRSFLLNSSSISQPSLDEVSQHTMKNLPYETATYICAPEQALLLQQMLRLRRPRDCLDIGSFTGFSTVALASVLPTDASVTSLELQQNYTDIAKTFTKDMPQKVDYIVGDAMDSLKKLAEEGRQFDFITMDSDKPNHEAYYNMSLKLLRPKGMMVMFGMLVFPTEEDQKAIENMHELMPNDTRVFTVLLPVGCGMQVVVKTGDDVPWFRHAKWSPPKVPQAPDQLSPHEEMQLERERRLEQKKWTLQAELVAIDNLLKEQGYDDLGKEEGYDPGNAPT